VKKGLAARLKKQNLYVVLLDIGKLSALLTVLKQIPNLHVPLNMQNRIPTKFFSPYFFPAKLYSPSVVVQTRSQPDLIGTG